MPLALVLLVSACGNQSEPVNLLLVTIDTVRADYLGCYGSADVRTPHLDRLAAGGVRYLQAVAPSQCTNPSHSSILTGLYLARHGVYDNETPLPGSATTLAEILADVGYQTLAAVSARHLNPGHANFGQGFATFLECEPVELTAGERNRSFLAELEKVADRPFFAWVHYFDPHGHYQPPALYDTFYPVGDDFPARRWGEAMDIPRPPAGEMVDPDAVIPLYKGEISYLDSEIGRLLDHLDKLGIGERTLVVVVGDHGESMTEKDIFFCHAGMYNQVLHVPLLMRLPGRLPAGHQVQSLVSPVDILPTVLDLLDLPPPAYELSGRSLTPTWRDPAIRVHEFVVSESVRGLIRAIYDGEFKYIQPFAQEWSMPTDHLYRVFTDYGELEDLKQSEAARAARLQDQLGRWLVRAGAQVLVAEEEHEVDEKTREALRSLGY